MMLFNSLNIQASLSIFDRQSVFDAMDQLISGAHDPMMGLLGYQSVQICPQNKGQITESVINALHQFYPATEFRLHANVHVLDQKLFSDLADIHQHKDYWGQLAKIHQALKAPIYSAHAGLRKNADMKTLIDHVRYAEDLFGSPVAVEGHYPAKGNPYLVANWAEYQQIFDSGVYYVIDLSHLNIVAKRSMRYESNLVNEMLNNPRCLEVHLSGNDGLSDQHRPMKEAPIWMDSLSHIHKDCVVFSESKLS